MINDGIQRKARVLIYGAGGRGRLLQLSLEEQRPDVCVVGYSDTFKRGTYGSLPIVPPEELTHTQFDNLVVASAHADAIITGLPELVLPKTLSYDPTTPPFDPREKGKRHVAIASTRSSQAALMNLFNAGMPSAGERFTVVHLDPEWTLSLWNPYLREMAAKGRIRHWSTVVAEDFDGVYVAEHGNEHVMRFVNSTPLAGVRLLNAGLRSRIRNTLLDLKAVFSRLNVLEFGSICSVAGGNYSTLSIAETLSDKHSVTTVNLDAGSIASAKSVCSEYPYVEYYCGTSTAYIEDRLDSAGDIHFACLLHQPCSEDLVVEEFERLDGHIPSGGRVLFAYNSGVTANGGLKTFLASKGYVTHYRDNAGWMLEKR